jgi:hypothetical protein
LGVPDVIAYMKTINVARDSTILRVRLSAPIPSLGVGGNSSSSYRLVNAHSANWMRKAPSAVDFPDLNRAVYFLRHAIDSKSLYYVAELLSAAPFQQFSGKGSTQVAKVNSSSSVPAPAALACVTPIPAVVAAPVAAPALADSSHERLLALEKSLAEMKLVPNPNYHGMAPQMGHHYGTPLGMGMGPAHHQMAFNVHGMYPPSGMFPQPPYPYGLVNHGSYDHR